MTDMAAATASSSSASSFDSLLQPLIARGWHLGDADKIHGLLTAQLSRPFTVDTIESELLNMDLRSIGGKCLPEPSLLRRTPHLKGPIVLQILSIRDISCSQVDDAVGNSGNRRLLRLKLTDGHSEVTAIEYPHVPSISDDVSPGTKVRLQNKAEIRSGILLLKKDVVTILGGVVESLYEEWKLRRKYLNVPRNTLKLSKENTSSGPPQFEKIQIGARGQGNVPFSYASTSEGTYHSSKVSGFSGSSSSDRKIPAIRGESSKHNVQLQKNMTTMDSGTDNLHRTVGENKDNENPTTLPARPKVTASAPVQNQEAARKLLQRMSQPNFNKHNPRSHRHRGKFQEEESNVMTLDEWEKRKTGSGVATTREHSFTSQDEDLARQLQEQLDLEDIHAQNASVEATDIKMTMFKFDREDVGVSNGRGFRGRGRRGRGRGRGRRV